MSRTIDRIAFTCIVAFLATCATESFGGTLTYSGTDLYTDPSVSFPNGIPTLIASSILLASNSPNNFPKLIVVPVAAAGTLTTGAVISITVNMTRRDCVAPCSGDESDSDPQLVVGDGTTLLGAGLDESGLVAAERFTDAGTYGINRTFTAVDGPGTAPADGDPFTVLLTYTLGSASTLISASAFGVTVSNASLGVLDPTKALYFSLIRDNDAGERYQIDSLSITTPVVPIPATAWLFGSALGILGIAHRRRYAMRGILALVVLLTGTAAQAALLGRAPLTPGGTDYQAYYDTAFDVTWLADANLAATVDFGVSGIPTGGYMTWAKSEEWIQGMNAATYLGASDWRLPASGSGCDGQFNCTNSELSNLYYVTLLGIAGVPLAMSHGPNYDLFANIEVGGGVKYWSATDYAPQAPQAAYTFWFGSYHGLQSYDFKSYNGYAWALRDGDINMVPVPAVGVLFGSALGVMGWMRRKGGI